MKLRLVTTLELMCLLLESVRCGKPGRALGRLTLLMISSVILALGQLLACCGRPMCGCRATFPVRVADSFSHARSNVALISIPTPICVKGFASLRRVTGGTRYAECVICNETGHLSKIVLRIPMEYIQRMDAVKSVAVLLIWPGIVLMKAAAGLLIPRVHLVNQTSPVCSLIWDNTLFLALTDDKSMEIQFLASHGQ